jgi:hypothetical protein
LKHTIQLRLIVYIFFFCFYILKSFSSNRKNMCGVTSSLRDPCSKHDQHFQGVPYARRRLCNFAKMEKGKLIKKRISEKISCKLDVNVFGCLLPIIVNTKFSTNKLHQLRVCKTIATKCSCMSIWMRITRTYISQRLQFYCLLWLIGCKVYTTTTWKKTNPERTHTHKKIK